MKKCFTILFAILCFILIQGTGQAVPLNPSFEYSTVGQPPLWPTSPPIANIIPTDWTVGSNHQVGVTGTYGGVSPVDGSWMTWVGFVDFDNDSVSDISGVAESDSNYGNSWTGAGNKPVLPLMNPNPPPAESYDDYSARYYYSSIFQVFPVEPYSTLSFQYNLFSWDGDLLTTAGWPEPYDFLSFIIGDTANDGTAMETIWVNGSLKDAGGNSFLRPGETLQSTGWRTFNYGVGNRNTIYLEIALGVTDLPAGSQTIPIETSSGFSSWAFIDNVTLQPIPEPASMMLLGAGLIGLTGFHRRKFRGHRRQNSTKHTYAVS